MKKVFLFFAALVLLAIATGCTIDVTPLASSESSVSSASSSSSESRSSSSSEVSSISSTAQSEPPRSDSSSQPGGQDGIEGKVAYSLIKMFENKRFYLRFLGDMGMEQEANTIMEFAMQDNMVAIRMDVEEMGGAFRMLMIDDELIYLLDGMKTIMRMPLTEENALDWDSMDTSGLQYVGMGSEEFRGRILPYEEYISESTTTRYFISGKNVVGIRSITPGEEPSDMEILEMSENIPVGIFDIPHNYTEVSSDTAF